VSGYPKGWTIGDAVTDFTLLSNNFPWPVRTLRQRDEASQWRPRTLAMSAEEWATPSGRATLTGHHRSILTIQIRQARP
jgi:hypothetical protein